jgi:RHS repeat-associated protein
MESKIMKNTIAILLVSLVLFLPGILFANDGSFSESISIDVPASPNGLTPAVSLSYNSNSKNSIAGLGWNIGGIMKIEKDKSYGIMRQGRVFTTPWGRLIDDDEYRFEVYANATVLWLDSSEAAVETDDGTTYYFTPLDKEIYYLTKKVDNFNNEINYSYEKIGTEYFPKHINYKSGNTTNRISFIYEGRVDTIARFSGRLIQIDKRLKAIEIYHGSTLLGKYDLVYHSDQNSPYSRLSRINQSVRNSSGQMLNQNPISFSWDYSHKFGEMPNNLSAQYTQDSRQRSVSGFMKPDYITGSDDEGNPVYAPTVFSQVYSVENIDLFGDGSSSAIIINKKKARLIVNTVRHNGVFQSDPMTFEDDGYSNIIEYYPLYFYGEDINGDGRDDLVMLRHAYNEDYSGRSDADHKRRRQLTVLLSDGTGKFYKSNSFLIDFGNEKHFANNIREPKDSNLYNTDSSGYKIPPTTSWTDVNGDGKVDLVMRSNYNARTNEFDKTPRVITYINQSTHDNVQFEMLNQELKTTSNKMQSSEGDVNGDGFPDIVYHRFVSGSNEYYINTFINNGTGLYVPGGDSNGSIANIRKSYGKYEFETWFNPQKEINNNKYSKAEHTVKFLLQPIAGDINGDGLFDISRVVKDGDNIKIKAWLSDGIKINGDNYKEYHLGTFPGTDLMAVFLQDFNQDGLQDLLIQMRDEDRGIESYVVYGTGDDFSPYNRVSTNHFNKDGVIYCSDYLASLNFSNTYFENLSNEHTISYSGTTIKDEAEISIGYKLQKVSAHSRDGLNDFTLISDNPSILTLNAGGPHTPTSHQFTLTHVKTDSNTKPLLSRIVYPNNTYKQINYNIYYPTYQHSFESHPDGKQMDTQTRVIVSHISSGHSQSKMHTQTGFFYGKPYTQTGSYFDTASYGFDMIKQTTRVYEPGSVNQYGPETHQWTYYETSHPKLAGYVKAKKVEISSKKTWVKHTYNVEEENIHGISYYKNTLEKSASYDSSLDTLNITHKTYNDKLYPTNVQSDIYIHTALDFDSFDIETTPYGSLIDSNTSNTSYSSSPYYYADSVTSYTNSELTSETRAYVHPSALMVETWTLVNESPNVYSHTRTHYKSDGTVDKIEVKQDEGVYSTSTYSYTYNNDDYIVTTAAPTGETTRTTYNYLGQKTRLEFPTGQISTFEYHDNYGRLTLVKDHTYWAEGKAIQSINYYNGFTQKDTTTYSYADYTSDYKKLTGTIIDKLFSKNWTYSPSTAINNEIKESEQYDNLGRLIKHTKSYVTKGGNINVETTTVYNPDGTVKQKSYPKAVGYDTDRYVDYVYDAYGRTTKKTFPNGSTNTYTYTEGEGKTTTVETFSNDGKSKSTTVETDLGNKTTKKTEANGNTLQFVNNNRGQLWKVINAENSTTEIRYTIAGLKTRMSDPNTGEYHYSYYPNGLLKEQQDATGVKVTFEYDLSGRNKKTNYFAHSSHSAPRKEIIYSYDTLTGTLSEVEDKYISVDPSNSWEYHHSFSYDKYANPIFIKRRIANYNYIFLMNYDTAGRVVRLTYPDGYEIHRHYSDGEFLNTVKEPGSDINDGYRYVTYGRFSVDSQGVEEVADNTVYRITGDKVQTAITYDPLTFKVTDVISTVTAGEHVGTVHEDLSYQYDWQGNVHHVIDNTDAQRLSAEYTYDLLNRIKTAKGKYGENFSEKTLSYTYTKEGNIDMFEGVDLQYNMNAHPHAVSQKEIKGTFFYNEYDQIGRLIRRNSQEGISAPTGGQTLTYNVMGKLKSVTGNGIPSEYYSYDYTGARVEKIRQDGLAYINTITIDGLFEVTDFSDMDKGMQYTRYILGINNEVVAQATVPRKTLLSMNDPAVYNYIYSDRSLKNIALWTHWYLSDIISKRQTFIVLVTLILISLALVTLFGLYEKMREFGLKYALTTAPTSGSSMFLFSIFSLFNGCYFESAPVTETPDWMEEEVEQISDEEESELEDWNDNDYGGGESSGGGTVDDDIGGPEDTNNKLDSTGVPKLNTRFFHPDYTGNVSYTTDFTGKVKSRMLYRPYGKVKVYGEDSHRAKFNTHELDQTGLSYFNARYYDSDTGRFISPDPTVPDPSNTQMFNRYMFVGGNPISFVDMDGYQQSESGSSNIVSDVLNTIEDAWNSLTGNSSQESSTPEPPNDNTVTQNDENSQYLHQSSQTLYQDPNGTYSEADSRDGIEFEIDDELRKAYDLVDEDQLNGMSEDDFVSARTSACVAISLYRALKLSGADVGSFGDFYADNVNADLIEPSNALVNNKVQISKNYGKRLVQINNPNKEKVSYYLKNSMIDDGVVRCNGHSYNVYYDKRTIEVYAADQGNWGRNGKKLTNAIPNNGSIQYFFFITEPIIRDN